MPVKLDKKIRSLIKRDRKVMLTTTREPYPYDFVPEHGEGDYVYDISGNRFIDFSSFIAVYNFGVNSRAAVREAMKKQMDSLIHPAFTDYYAELPVVFAEKLVRMLPRSFGRVFFSNSGTEANEAAIKFSRLFTKRQYIISFYGAFHGRTMGSLSLTASKTVHRERFGPFNSTVQAPYAYCYRCPLHKEESECCLQGIDVIRNQILGKTVSEKECAAIFFEPVQGEGGYVVPPKEFVTELRKLADEHGILLVADEVQSGYMRTGRFLALDHFGVEADIYTFAKAIAGGMPMGATVTRKSLGDIPSGAHANTFGGNLIAVAAANANIDYIKRNMASLKRDSKEKGSLIMKRLNQMKERYEIVGDVRGLGMMIGVELVKNKRTKEPAIKEREGILDYCFENNLILLPAGISTIRIVPPLTMSKQNIEKGLDVLEAAIKKFSS